MCKQDMTTEKKWKKTDHQVERNGIDQNKSRRKRDALCAEFFYFLQVLWFDCRSESRCGYLVSKPARILPLFLNVSLSRTGFFHFYASVSSTFMEKKPQNRVFDEDLELSRVGHPESFYFHGLQFNYYPPSSRFLLFFILAFSTTIAEQFHLYARSDGSKQPLYSISSRFLLLFASNHSTFPVPASPLSCFLQLYHLFLLFIPAFSTPCPALSCCMIPNNSTPYAAKPRFLNLHHSTPCAEYFYRNGLKRL